MDPAGTKEPAWASITSSAACLRYVDFPAMFGPVTSIILFSGTSSVSLGTHSPTGRMLSSTGCLPSLITRQGSRDSSGLTHPPFSAASARDESTSISESILPAFFILSTDEATLPRRSEYIPDSSRAISSSAPWIRFSISFSSGVM